MSDCFALHMPFNGTSLGSLSFAIARELFRRKLNPTIFPIGPIDGSAQPQDIEFFTWIQENINRALKDHKRSYPVFRNWHLQGLMESVSDRQIVLSWYETNQPTEFETNLVKNTTKVLFTSNYTIEKFKDLGCQNVGYLPLFFDADNFKPTPRPYKDDRIVYGVYGKWEPLRKRHAKTIETWVEGYKNKHSHFLHLAVANRFYQDPNIVPREISQAIFAGSKTQEKIWNVQPFFNWINTNLEYNALLNGSDVVIGGGNENWGLPEFHSVAMGKHAIILNANGYKSWATPENSVIIDPSGMIEANDGIFFRKGTPFSQGSFFDYSKEDLVSALIEVEKRVRANRVNEAGLKLQQEFTVQKTVDKILEEIH